MVQKNRVVGLPPIQGRLLQVNTPYRFVVLDQGSDQGVRIGMVFSMVREASMIGRVVITRVRPRFSAGEILSIHGSTELRAGDFAIQVSTDQ